MKIGAIIAVLFGLLLIVGPIASKASGQVKPGTEGASGVSGAIMQGLGVILVIWGIVDFVRGNKKGPPAGSPK